MCVLIKQFTVLCIKPSSKCSKSINQSINQTCQYRSLPTSLSTLHSINVSPPLGLVYYFAFGADVNAEWLRQTIGIEPESAGWAVLYGLRLSYVEMPESGNTRVSLVSDSRAAVQGFVYLLRPDELKSLDVNFTSIAKVNVITFRHQTCCKNYGRLVEI